MYVQYSVHNAAASVQKWWKYIKDASNICMYNFSEIISESKGVVWIIFLELHHQGSGHRTWEVDPMSRFLFSIHIYSDTVLAEFQISVP